MRTEQVLQLHIIRFFFFNDPAPTEIYTLSLHDALPIPGPWSRTVRTPSASRISTVPPGGDRKSTRLNSSHGSISYAVFGWKKKKTQGSVRRRLLGRGGTARRRRSRCQV